MQFAEAWVFDLMSSNKHAHVGRRGHYRVFIWVPQGSLRISVASQTHGLGVYIMNTCVMKTCSKGVIGL